MKAPTSIAPPEKKRATRVLLALVALLFVTLIAIGILGFYSDNDFQVSNFTLLLILAFAFIGFWAGMIIGLKVLNKDLIPVTEASEARTRAIVESAHDAFIGMDQKGFITDWNRQAEVTIGWKRDEVLGTLLTDKVISPPYREAHRKGLENYLQSGEGHILNRRMELTVQHRMGHQVPVEMTIYPIQYEEGVMFGSFLHDITERREAQQKLSTLNKELEARVNDRTRELAEANVVLKSEVATREKLYQEVQLASRLKDEFLATVSHELRTPLNVIMGHSDIIKDGRLNKDELTESLDAIHRNAHVQVQIINDLLDVSKIISGKLDLNFKSVNLRELILASIQSVKVAANARNIQIATHIDDSVGAIGGDFDRLQQVMWNLLTNAIKFTQKGGKITVTLRSFNSRAQIEVKDDGQGIDADFIPFVFDRFRQEDSSTTRKFGGLGLGLSIVRHIVEAHGGNVRVHSEGKGQGSVFVVNLPILSLHFENFDSVESPQWTRDFSEHERVRADLNGYKILIVDDEVDTRRMLSRVIQKAGADVQAAASVTEAMILFQEGHPDLVLSDVSMPEHDGYNLIHTLRNLPGNIGKTVPAIALTAHARKEDQKRAEAAGFDLHLAKPIEVAKLVEEIANVLKKACGLRS